jgi:hypothetical protein
MPEHFRITHRSAIVAGVVLGAAGLITGIALQNSFGARSDLCNSALGLAGQRLATAAVQATCATWTFGAEMGTALMWFGGILFVGTALAGLAFSVRERNMSIAQTGK